MIRFMRPPRAPLPLLLLAACTAPSPPLDGPAPADLAPPPDLAVDKAAACASTFGAALTNAFGRLDGTVLAVVPPAHPTCAMPNGTHLVLQVTAGGAAYRMVVNVQSDIGPDLRVSFAIVDHALPGVPFRDGWHPGETLDYAATLGLHSTAFTPEEMAPLVARITDAIPLGGNVSVYATSSGGASAHLVHRNGANHDGAIVLDPTGPSPRFLLFRFADQSF